MPRISVEIDVPDGKECSFLPPDRDWDFCRFCFNIWDVTRERKRCLVFDINLKYKTKDHYSHIKKCPACLAACKESEGGG